MKIKRSTVEAIVFLTVLICAFVLLGSRMGGGNMLKTLMNTVGRAEGKTSALYAGLKGYLSALGKTKEYSLDGSLPLPVISAAKSFIDEAKPYLGLARGYGEALREEYFRAMSFVRTSDLFDETGYRALRIPSEEDKKPYGRLRLWCFDPTPLLTKVMKRMRGCVMFSATLSPIEHYGRLLGADGAAGDTLLDLPSPFPRENLLSAAISIPTRYSAREESADKVAQALKALASSRTGNYLACFPSHAYMSLVARTFLSIAGDVDVLIQRRDMSEREREEFLSRFTPAPGRSLLAFVAMGGVFSEGIDLPGDRLIGAAIVGVGMPQICYERNALADLYNDDDGEGGFETAYLYPGIGKCLQAAGRVIRSEKDVGAVLFIDERYALPEYRKLLPPHLKPLKLREEKIGEALEMFWERHEQ